jgi:hypothetical protein
MPRRLRKGIVANSGNNWANVMSASKEAKAAGLPNLKYVYTQANVKRTTFNGWYHSNRQLFDVVVAGVKSLKDKGE